MKRARRSVCWVLASAAAAVAVSAVSTTSAAWGQTTPAVVDPNLGVRTVVGGLTTPSTMAFLGPDDFLVLEKNTGQVKRIVDGAAEGVVLDLSVNFGSERGLLGIALHPDFPANPGVYLFWSCRSTTPLDADPFMPEEQECSDDPSAMVGPPDTNDLLQVPLLRNRVDRFVWTGDSLVFDRNLLKLRSFQNDGGPQPPGQNDQAQPPRGNHDGGVLAFGPDRKLYVAVGDLGRRGQMQNLAQGPTPPTADDQFGGPQPDNAHLSGVILRLNDDGTTPADNPFFGVGSQMGGEAGANIQRLFAYGLRNTFGIAFDPVSGNLWDQQNTDDAFDELNRVERGMNGGWIQIMGPVERIAQFKQIELTLPPSGGVPGQSSSNSAGRRPTSRILPPTRSRACSRCRAPATAIRSSAGGSRSRRAASASWIVEGSARSMQTTCSSARPRPSRWEATCSGST
jgi:aldose sugar dehydrogenase